MIRRVFVGGVGVVSGGRLVRSRERDGRGERAVVWFILGGFGCWVADWLDGEWRE